MKLSPALSAELVAFVAQHTGRARVTITGTSMEPLLRAGMVIDVEPLDGPPRRGDILVFKSQRGLVAHRLVGGERFALRAHSGLLSAPHAGAAPAFLTSGDANPGQVETVPPELVVGRVSAVWSSADPAARRVDDAVFRQRGGLVARTRRLRSLIRKLRGYAALLVAEPAAPPRAFAVLVAATRAFELGRYDAGVALLDSVAWPALVAMVRRHHASGLIGDWLAAAAADTPVPAELNEAVRRIGWTTALQAGRVLTALAHVRDTLAAAGVPHIFLKGGGRLAAGAPGAERQFSGDLDVLVPAACADRALDALRAAGYRDIRPAAERPAYRSLHHREPLRSPTVDVPVEVHVALVAPAVVSARLDYPALAADARRVRGPAGEALVLNDVAAAVHLAYHARDQQPWRDIVLLSRLLRSFDAAARTRFNTFIAAERRDAVRLAGAVAAAEALVSGEQPRRADVRRYLAWARFREDLPRRLAHVDLIEAALGACPIQVLRLDYTQRTAAVWVRRWLRNMLVLPAIVRLGLRRLGNDDDDRSRFGFG